jgi:endo-1,4-beta-xylanase
MRIVGPEVSRRRFLSTAAAAGAGLGFAALPRAQHIVDSPTDFSPLRDHASRRGLVYGAAGGYKNLGGDTDFAQLFARECGIMVPENELKWRILRPTQDSFSFAQADWLLNFASRYRMQFRGHTLVWHQQLPDWIRTQVNSSNARQILLNHVNTVVGHYAGKLQSWDVVNEVIEPADRRPDGLRSKPWLESIGPEYIDLAFQTAAQTDPKVLLVWNENHLEGSDERALAKREVLIKLLREKLRRNIPIQAIGLQSHISGTSPSFNNPEFIRFLHTISDMGVKILITEMDVTEVDLPTNIDARDQAVAGVYSDYLSTVLREKSVIAVLTWGLSDRYTWLSSYLPRTDKTPVRPLPFDSNLNPTATYAAIARAFDQASVR